MFESSSFQTEKQSRNQQLVAALQEERAALWAMYCKIAEMKPFFNDADKVRPLLASFSQLLIDYVSLGHFSIYEHLLAEKHQQLGLLSYANALYPAFSNTTVSAISFNDMYDDGRRNFKTDNLESDLSKLGEHLAKRMELEDRLCSMLLH